MMGNEVSDSPICLTCGGAEIQISSSQQNLIEQLREDFIYFEGRGEVSLARIEVREVTLVEYRPKGVRFAEGSFDGWGKKREVRYRDGSRIHFIHGQPHVIQMDVSSSVRSRELLTLLLHSLWGEYLERNGWRRLHGVGLGEGGKIHAYLGKSGIGKSSLVVRVLNETEKLITSDEIVWLKGNKVKGYPIRVGLSSDQRPPQCMLRLAKFERLRFPPKEVYLLPKNRLQAEGQVQKMYFHSQFSNLFLARLDWIFQVTVGFHLPQMLEIFLRGPNIGFLILMTFSRLAFALRVQFTNRLEIVPAAKFLNPKLN